MATNPKLVATTSQPAVVKAHKGLKLAILPYETASAFS